MSEIKAVVGKWPTYSGTSAAQDAKMAERRAWERKRTEIAVDQLAKDDLDYALLRAILFGEGK